MTSIFHLMWSITSWPQTCTAQTSKYNELQKYDDDGGGDDDDYYDDITNSGKIFT